MVCQSLSSLLSRFDEALGDEIDVATQTSGQRYDLHGGKQLGVVSDGVLYRFHLNRPCSIPDEADVKVKLGSAGLDATVVSVRGLEIILSFVTPLGDHPDRLVLSLIVDLTYISKRLRERLNAHGRPSLFDLTACGHRWHPNLGTGQGQPLIPATLPEELNDDQREAIVSSLKWGVRFIWGPPGTGKTLTVGHLAAVAAGAGLRVLVCAYSNVAVDVAALAVAEASPEDLRIPGKVLRVGTPHLDEVRNHPWLTTRAVLQARQPELYEQLGILQDAHARLMDAAERDEDELDRVRLEIRHLRALIRIEEDALVRQARVVCCTLARLVTAANMSELRPFDLVILDEASMASVPYAALAATHSRRSVVYAGDFRQLPPIVQAETEIAERWLGRDVFDHAGITERARQGTWDDERMVMLRTQYRMHSQIAQIVSSAFYAGKLTTAADVDARVDPIGKAGPYATRRTVIIDVKQIGSYAKQQPKLDGGRQSRFNVVTALTALILARKVPEKVSVGIITPFRAQAQLIATMIRDTASRSTEVSTGHRFQGGEVDIAILDLTVAKGMKNLSPLLDGDSWELAGRLINVAISRPRGKLIIIQDGDYLARQQLAAGAAGQNKALFRLGKTLQDLRVGRHTISVDEFAAHLSALPGHGDGNHAQWPMARLHTDPMFGTKKTVRIASARHQLGLYVHGQTGPADWARRSSDTYHADVFLRGQSAHPSWQQVAPHRWSAGPQSDLSFSAFVADGIRVGIDLHLKNSARTLELCMPAAARFLAENLQLLPRDVPLVTL